MKILQRSARIRTTAAAGVAVAALAATGAVQAADAAPGPGPASRPSSPQGPVDTGKLPADVQKALQDFKAVAPGPGFAPSAAYLATGTQTWTCTSAGGWPTSGSVPEARLVRLPRGGDTVHHYGGPRWEATDGSILRGVLPPRSQVAKSGTIPWLLLDVTHEGASGSLDPVTNISRILTSGGLPPSGACVPGTTTSPSYRAVYVFWVPGSGS